MEYSTISLSFGSSIQKTNYSFMKKILPLLLSSIFIFSCNNNKKESQSTPSLGAAQITAAYITPDPSDTVRKVEILYRVIQKTIQFDSIKNQDIIIVDTFWGFKKFIPILDSTGKPKKDSLGRTFVDAPWWPIGKDSVNWKIQGVPYDTLIKKSYRGN